MNLSNWGGTMTGGATKALTLISLNAGGAAFATPDHTRLEPETVTFYAQPAKSTASDPGVARAGMKISLAQREAAEGCCTIQAGSVIVDVGIRWSLNQPETLVDDALKYLQSAAFTSALADAVKKGTIPTS